MFGWTRIFGKLLKYSGVIIYNILFIAIIVIGIIIIPIVSGIVSFIVAFVTVVLIVIWTVSNAIIGMSIWTYHKSTAVATEALELAADSAEMIASTATWIKVLNSEAKACIKAMI
jgi:hypothetical protein